jgi:hypothetical protein
MGNLTEKCYDDIIMLMVKISIKLTAASSDYSATKSTIIHLVVVDL